MSMTMLASTGVSAIGSHLTIATRGLAILQAQDMINSGNSKLLEFFIGLVAVAMLVQAVFVVALALGAMKVQKELMGHVNEIRGKLTPLITKSHILVNDLAPEIKQITARVNEISGKVNVITAHFEEIAAVAKDKVNEFAPTMSAANETVVQANDTVRIANKKTREQVERVNDMVTSTLNATAKLGKALEHSISIPGRELAGLIAGFRASVDVLVDRAKSYNGPRVVPGRGPITPRPTASETAAKVTAFRTVAETPYAYSEHKRDIDL